MAARLPVVATRVGGTPELVEEGVSGFLVPPRDARSLADRLWKVYADPDTARSMGLRGRAFVERELSLERMVDAHEALYRRALGLQPVAPSAANPPHAAS